MVSDNCVSQKEASPKCKIEQRWARLYGPPEPDVGMRVEGLDGKLRQMSYFLLKH